MASYYAQVFIGIEVTKADFIKQRMETEVLCTHPEAEGKNFCPECGASKTERTKDVTKEEWTTAFAPIAEALEAEWEIKVSWDVLFDDDEGELFEGGLSLHQVNTSSEDSDGVIILGAQVADVNDEGYGNDSNPEVTPFSDLKDYEEAIETARALLGIGERPIRHYTGCYCSI